MNIRGANLSAKIAVDSVPHVGGKIGVHAFPVCIGNTEAFQLFCCCLNPLSAACKCGSAFGRVSFVV